MPDTVHCESIPQKAPLSPLEQLYAQLPMLMQLSVIAHCEQLVVLHSQR